MQGETGLLRLPSLAVPETSRVGYRCLHSPVKPSLPKLPRMYHGLKVYLGELPQSGLECFLLTTIMSKEIDT